MAGKRIVKRRPLNRLRVSSPAIRSVSTAGGGEGRLVAHPEVVGRITINVSRRSREIARRTALAVVRIIRRNIETEQDGRWAPLTSRDGRALETRSRDWTARKTERGYTVGTDFFWWDTHTQGKTIRPRRGRFLRFRVRGKIVFARKVVIPRRDPRPTVAQLQAEFGSR